MFNCLPIYTLPIHNYHNQNTQNIIHIVIIHFRIYNNQRLAELSTKTLFDSPPRRCTHAYLFFEIKSAEYFEYDNIHVRYRISIPSGCTIINDGYALPLQKIGDCTEGSTHSSLKCHTDGVWKFGHCHNLNVLCGDGYRFDGKTL